MRSEILMQTHYVTVTLDSTRGIIIAKWRGFLSLDDVRQGCGFITHLFKTQYIRVHLSEHRELRVLSKDVQDFLINEWFPEVEKIGVRKIGVVEANDAFAEASVLKVNQEGEIGNLKIEVFATFDDCMRWLLLP